MPPTILLEFSGKASMAKAFVKLKTSRNIKLVQINTAVFSYEPILQRIQQIKKIELKDEILCWEPGVTVDEPPKPPQDIIAGVEASGPSSDLRNLLGITQSKEIKLDRAQASSLLMGLKQRLSLIQGPPGRLDHSTLECISLKYV
jgi:hypothetical protein